MIAFSVKSRELIFSIERGTKVAISITTIAPRAIAGTIAISKATVVAIVVAHLLVTEDQE